MSAAGGICSDARWVAGAGRSDVLGLYLEAGVRCRILPPVTLTVGARYDELRGYTWPVGILSYEQPISQSWRMSLTGSLHERSGDYELDRLPELALRWTPQVGDAFVAPWLDVFAGHLRVYNPFAEAGRIGTALSLSTRSFVNDSRTNAWLFLKAGEYWYETGNAYSYWSGSFTVSFRPVAVTEFALIYGEVHGVGTSPLTFDVLTPDQSITGRLGFTLESGDTVLISGVVNLLTSPTNMKEYDLAWTRPGEWAATVTWRLSDGKVLFGITVPP